jgi:SOS response regulatory protein OraA/RecX
VPNAATKAKSESKKKNAKPYRTKPRPLGLRKGFSYDKISSLIARTEGEHYR